ncbi:MAG: ParM/StbA family protein [Peptostreptococcaceae bacterium]
MKIAIDIGNRNMKVAYSKGGKVKFDTFQSRYTKEPQLDYSTSEHIMLDGVTYCIEQGEYDFEHDKSNKNYLPFLLTAICRATDEVIANVELMIGAPAEQVLGKRETFKEQLSGKTFEFDYCGAVRKVIIGRVGVIGEGFATYFALPAEVRNNKNVGILDIGGKTVNMVTFINKKQDKVFTFNDGMLNLKNDLLKAQKALGKDYDINTIENLLDMGNIEIPLEVKESFVGRVINSGKSYKIDKDLFKWVATGGGSIDIGSDVLDKYFGKDCLMDNALYTNVLGYYNFMIAKWGE